MCSSDLRITFIAGFFGRRLFCGLFHRRGLFRGLAFFAFRRRLKQIAHVRIFRLIVILCAPANCARQHIVYIRTGWRARVGMFLAYIISKNRYPAVHKLPSAANSPVRPPLRSAQQRRFFVCGEVVVCVNTVVVVIFMSPLRSSVRVCSVESQSYNIMRTK